MDLSRQANMTTDAFQRLESQMIYLNIAQEKADKSLTTFGNRWRDLSSGHPSSKAIGEVEDGDLSGVYERYVKPNLGIKDTTSAMRKIIDDVKKSGQPDYMQARIYSQLGIDEGYAYKSPKEIAAARQHETIAVPRETVEQLEESRKNHTIRHEDSLDRAKNWFTAKAAKTVDAIHDFTSAGDEAVFGTGGDDETKKTITESTTEGTKEGMLQAWREITGGGATFNDRFQFGGKPGDGSIVPQAYHPDGGVAQTVKALHSGGGYEVLDQDVGGNGNTRGDRNNNPGNLKFGPLAKAFGATHADDKGFAVFPNKESGDAAMEARVKSNSYSGLTLDQFGNKYAEGNADWKKTVGAALGIGPNGIVNNNDPRLLGAIKKAEGTGRGASGGGGYTGVGGYNFMGSARAHAMGMDIRAFSPEAQMKWATGITNGNGPASIRANKYAGGDMAGFLKDLSDAGAPLDQFAGAYVHKPRQHGYGNALDIETGFGSGPDNSPHLYAWAKAHPKEFAAIQAKHHMRNLDTSSGASMHDWGHFEFSPTGDAPFTNAKGLGGGAHMSDRVKHGTHHKLSVDFTNMPKGVRTGYSGDKGLFKEVKLNRGRAMGFASQDS
jgi:hypothetical protein